MGDDLKIKGKAILFSEMTPPSGKEEEFNDWYDGHHSPSHVQGVPGFISAMRYKSDDGPHYLAVYELTGQEALEHEEYKKRKLTPDDPTYQMLHSVSGFTRYIAEEKSFETASMASLCGLNSQIVYCQFLSLSPDKTPDFVAYFKDEMISSLRAGATWKATRHLKIVQYDPEPYSDLILHYLDEINLEGRVWETRSAGKFQPHNVFYRRRGSRFLKTE
jgi:hypothetical protein